MKHINKLILCISLIGLCACNDFLDVVPDNIPTIDHAFNNRASAEKYLYTCYSYLPDPCSPNYTPQLMSGNECWINPLDNNRYWYDLHTFDIARGYQNTNEPILNFWDGRNAGTNLFIALRDCNIFLENIDKPADLELYDKARWIAEVKALKAYYHFYLLRMYGPIPIVKENIPVSSDIDEVKVYRDPVEDVFAYIVALLDEAAADLPEYIQNRTQEIGRLTKPIALALKAKALTLAASPLFNGNPYYANMKDNRGISLFPQTYDPEKWTLAAAATLEAIEAAHAGKHELYYYKGFNPVSEDTRRKLHIRNAVTERWNDEIVWGSTKDQTHLQKVTCTRTRSNQASNDEARSMMSPTLDVVETFYTKNGVPINEDKTWDYENRYQVREAEEDHKYFIKTGHITANLNFDREIRYYASLSFDGGIIYGNGILNDEDANIGYGQMKKGQIGGVLGVSRYTVTGYLPKKLVSYETVIEGNTFSAKRYSFPVIRLADLYLMMAEALNESKAAPDTEVYKWIDLVRERASLEGVVESWNKYSINPEKVTTQAGMHDIIHQERMNELAFEGERYWDLLRWKKAEDYMNKPIKGWNVMGETTEEYYEIKVVAQPEFLTKNYFFPLRKASLDVNSNLIQNPGW